MKSISEVTGQHEYIAPAKVAEECSHGRTIVFLESRHDPDNEFDGRPAPRYVFTMEFTDEPGVCFSLGLGETESRKQLHQALQQGESVGPGVLVKRDSGQGWL